MALLQAINLLLLQEEEKNPGKVFDTDFIKSKTEGYDCLCGTSAKSGFKRISPNHAVLTWYK